MLQNDKKTTPLVLIFSDSNEIVSLMEAFLEFWNYRTAVAFNEKQLFRLIEIESPLILLFDFSYDLKSDLELMNYLRNLNLFKNTPILALSGHARHDDINLAYTAGADEYFTKPIDFDYLHYVLNKHALSQANT